MDILSLQQAKKAKKAMKALETRVGSNAPGSYVSVKARIEALEATGLGLPFHDRVSDLEAKTAINLNKHNLKMNAVLNHSRYGLTDLLVDDFQDASGIDTSKSANHEFDAATKKVKIATGQSSANLVTVAEDTGVVPSMIMVSQSSNESPFAEKTADLSVGTFVDAEVVDRKIQLKVLKQVAGGLSDDITPAMAANTLTVNGETYTVSASSYYDGNYVPWKAFTNANANMYDAWVTGSGSPLNQWLMIELPLAKKVVQYAITGRNENAALTLQGTPKDWKLQGSNDNFVNEIVDVDVRTGESNWTYIERRVYSVGSPGTFKAYRIFITANNGNANWSTIGELELMEEILGEVYSSSGSWESPVLDLGSNFKQITRLQSFVFFDGETNTISSVPVMNDYSLDEINVSASSENTTGDYNAWKAFNGTVTGQYDCWIGKSANEWLQVDFGFPVGIKEYTITNRDHSSRYDPAKWTLQGSNDLTTWDILHTVTSQSAWAQKEKRTFKTDIFGAYRYYRIWITGGISVGSGGAYAQISQLSLFESNWMRHINIFTSTSSDGVTFSSYQLINPDGTFASPSARYVKVKVELTGGTEIIPRVVNEFETGESTQFQANDKVVFDGSLKLKTFYSDNMNEDTSYTEAGTLFRKTINKNDFIKIEKIEVR